MRLCQMDGTPRDRFTEIPLADGGSYLDRTTLIVVGPDEVRQVIEISRDGGKSWRTTFDARYVRQR